MRPNWYQRSMTMENNLAYGVSGLHGWLYSCQEYQRLGDDLATRSISPANMPSGAVRNRPLLHVVGGWAAKSRSISPRAARSSHIDRRQATDDFACFACRSAVNRRSARACSLDCPLLIGCRGFIRSCRHGCWLHSKSIRQGRAERSGETGTEMLGVAEYDLMPEFRPA